MKKRILLTALLTQLCAFSVSGYGNDWFAYVTNATLDGSPHGIIPINLATQAVGSSIPTGFGPISIAITPDAQKAYVTNFSSNTVSVVDITTNTFIATIHVGTAPVGVAITPDGSTAVVVNEFSNSASIIDTSTNLITDTILLPFSQPFDVAISPDGITAYVTFDSASSAIVLPIDLTTNTLETPIPLPPGTKSSGITITPDGTTAYIANDNISSVTPIDLITRTAGTPLLVGNNPVWLVTTPNGKTVYVTEPSSHAIVPIDVATNTVGAPISLTTSQPEGIAITPDSKTAYTVIIGGPSGAIPLDTATNVLGAVIPAGTVLFGIAITPDQAPHALFTATPGVVGSPTFFDASSSFSPTGAIATYQWDFGDATGLITASPTISHTYTSSGIFNVTLTVTNTAGTSTTQTFTGHTMCMNGGPVATLTQAIDIPTAPIAAAAPLPPTGFRGHVERKVEHSHIDNIHVLHWNASPDPSVSHYLLQRGWKVIAKIKAGEKHFSYHDHHRPEKAIETYTLCAVNHNGLQSVVLTLTLPKPK